MPLPAPIVFSSLLFEDQNLLGAALLDQGRGYPRALDGWRPDLHATVLHQLGLDHRQLSFLHAGREETLTDSQVTGAQVIDDLLRA